MKTTEKEVRYIAELAHLNLSDEEVKAYQADLEEILSYVDKLQELNVDDVAPMSHVLQPGEAENVSVRDDELKPSFDRDRALQNAPLAGAGHFKVPLVIER